MEEDLCGYMDWITQAEDMDDLDEDGNPRKTNTRAPTPSTQVPSVVFDPHHSEGDQSSEISGFGIERWRTSEAV